MNLPEELLLRSFSHDPCSGLAGILAHVNILEMQLKLFVKRIKVFGCCSDLAFGTKLHFWAGRALARINGSSSKIPPAIRVKEDTDLSPSYSCVCAIHVLRSGSSRERQTRWRLRRQCPSRLACVARVNVTRHVESES
jgi:hypothetical protein